MMPPSINDNPLQRINFAVDILFFLSLFE